MKKCIKNQLIVISELNDQITNIKEKYNQLKMEGLHNSTAIEDTFDASRSFGRSLLNSDKENLDISHIERKPKGSVGYSYFTDLLEGDENGEVLENNDEEALSTEMEQLRKYNNELMQKLDGVYKTVQSLTTEATEVREKNRNLRKENKFYKKQIEDLRKLHSRFERDLMEGRF